MYHSDESDKLIINDGMGGSCFRHGAVMTIEDIKRVSAEECGCELSDIDGQGRLRKDSLARQIAIYFTRKLHGVVETGKHFGRVHSNISHTCKKVEDYIECDREYRDIIKKVEAKLG